MTLYQCVCNPTTSKYNPTVNISSSVPVIIKIIKTKEAVCFLELESIKIKERWWEERFREEKHRC